MRHARLLIAGIALMGFAAPANAGPITFYSIASAGVTVRPSGDSALETIKEDFKVSAGPANATKTDPDPLGQTGTAYAWVDSGILHASATSGAAGALAGGIASYFDTVTVTSSLPAGSLLEFLFEMDLSYTLTGSCGNLVNGAIDVSTYTAGPAVAVQEVLCNPALDISNPTRVLQFQVGDVFTINTYLNAAVGGFTAGSADASNTMSFFITPLGNDFGYTTASGQDFSRRAVAPEPATMLLLGTGLLGAGMRRWRQKRA